MTPTVSIQKSPPGFAMPMEIRPDLMNWANLNLPGAAGTWWLALAVDRSVPLTCPANFNFPPMWSFVSDMTLDMSSQANQCTNCLLPAYACFKSDGVADLSSTERLLVERGMSGFGRAVRSLSLPGGWLCFGPSDTLLSDAAAEHWVLNPFTAYVNISATQPITIHYYVENFYGTNKNVQPEPAIGPDRRRLANVSEPGG